MTSATMSGEPSISQGKGSMPLASAENLEGVFMPEMSLLPLGTVVDGKGSGPGWGQLRFMVAGYFPVVKSDGDCLDCTAAPWPLGCVDIDDGTKKSAVSPSLSGERSRAGRRRAFRASPFQRVRHRLRRGRGRKCRGRDIVQGFGGVRAVRVERSEVGDKFHSLFPAIVASLPYRVVPPGAAGFGAWE